ncbi:NAD-dependent epimerase/dehydratase family protein [Vibrio pomeroyi]|uniref:NAD-dependent epimerase/dehydratase family protein n=1 Tax=Vibrio pomeroyi TaxID=198832 RepID=UPI0021C334D7|nr:NAD-dependent epimerase/dehydratase family protein [Vibrio pomeroyi]
MTTLVTGATGFVGKELAKREHRFRYVVRVGVDHSFEDYFVVPTIDSETNWSHCFDGIHSIIHLAGLAHNNSFSESEYSSINTQGTLKLALKAAEAGVRRFVFVSSIGVNGTTSLEGPFLPDDTAKPHNSYTQSKYEAELGLWDLSKKTGLEVVVVRPTLVYGPNAPGNFGRLIKLIQKVPVLPFGLASNCRDFISVQNLADLLIVCTTHENAAGNIFLASDNETVSIKEFTKVIGDGIGKNILQFPVPVWAIKIVGKILGKSEIVEQLYGDLQVDSSNIKKILGWTPPLTMKQSMSLLRNSRN